MQLTAYHDSEGNIVGLVVSPPDSVPVEAQTEAHPGLLRTEVEAPEEITFSPDSPQEIYENINKLRENYQVEVHPRPKGKLKRKPAPASEQSSAY